MEGRLISKCLLHSTALCLTSTYFLILNRQNSDTSGIFRPSIFFFQQTRIFCCNLAKLDRDFLILHFDPSQCNHCQYFQLNFLQIGSEMEAFLSHVVSLAGEGHNYLESRSTLPLFRQMESELFSKTMMTMIMDVLLWIIWELWRM